jgi:hypothetical protein
MDNLNGALTADICDIWLAPDFVGNPVIPGDRRQEDDR